MLIMKKCKLLKSFQRVILQYYQNIKDGNCNVVCGNCNVVCEKVEMV